jgi:hypothetical protein
MYIYLTLKSYSCAIQTSLTSDSIFLYGGIFIRTDQLM